MLRPFVYLKGAKFFPVSLGWNNLFVDQNQFFHEFDSHNFVFLATISDGNVDLTVVEQLESIILIHIQIIRMETKRYLTVNFTTLEILVFDDDDSFDGIDMVQMVNKVAFSHIDIYFSVGGCLFEYLNSRCNHFGFVIEKGVKRQILRETLTISVLRFLLL